MRASKSRFAAAPIAQAIIIFHMASVSKKPRRTRKQFALAPADNREYDNKSFEDQVAHFSKLAMENPSKPIYRLWSKLDFVARTVILSELGCLPGDTRRLTRAQHFEWAREDAAELKRHTRALSTFLEKQAAHEKLLARRPRFYMPRRYFAEPEGRGTLKKVLEIEKMHLRSSVTAINRMRKSRGTWFVRGMIIAQEYVARRADFLAIRGRVRLTPEAIADIYELTQCPRERGDDLGTAESIRKAISYYYEQTENAYFIQNIEFYLQDWKKPALRPRSGN